MTVQPAHLGRMPLVPQLSQPGNLMNQLLLLGNPERPKNQLNVKYSMLQSIVVQKTYINCLGKWNAIFGSTISSLTQISPPVFDVRTQFRSNTDPVISAGMGNITFDVLCSLPHRASIVCFSRLFPRDDKGAVENIFSSLESTVTQISCTNSGHKLRRQSWQ